MAFSSCRRQISVTSNLSHRKPRQCVCGCQCLLWNHHRLSPESATRFHWSGWEVLQWKNSSAGGQKSTLLWYGGINAPRIMVAGEDITGIPVTHQNRDLSIIFICSFHTLSCQRWTLCYPHLGKHCRHWDTGKQRADTQHTLRNKNKRIWTKEKHLENISNASSFSKQQGQKACRCKRRKLNTWGPGYQWTPHLPWQHSNVKREPGRQLDSIMYYIYNIYIHITMIIVPCISTYILTYILTYNIYIYIHSFFAQYISSYTCHQRMLAETSWKVGWTWLHLESSCISTSSEPLLVRRRPESMISSRRPAASYVKSPPKDSNEYRAICYMSCHTCFCIISILYMFIIVYILYDHILS